MDIGTRSSGIGEKLASLLKVNPQNAVLWIVLAVAVVFFAVAIFGEPFKIWLIRRKQRKE